MGMVTRWSFSMWYQVSHSVVYTHMRPNVSCTQVIVCLSPSIALMPTQLELLLVVWWVDANAPFKPIDLVLLSQE
ncbi:hypothetical protein U1Q18_004821 [Sarracenia purpurea var. burkii]